MEEALSAELIPTPRKFPSPLNADQNRHCYFHRNYDHKIEECLALKTRLRSLSRLDSYNTMLQSMSSASYTHMVDRETGVQKSEAQGTKAREKIVREVEEKAE